MLDRKENLILPQRVKQELRSSWEVTEDILKPFIHHHWVQGWFIVMFPKAHLLFFGTLHSNGSIFPFLLCFSLFLSQLFVRPPQRAIMHFCISSSFFKAFAAIFLCRSVLLIIFIIHSFFFFFLSMELIPTHTLNQW